MKSFAKQALRWVLSPNKIWGRLLPARILVCLDRLSTPPSGDNYYGQRAKEYEAVRVRQDWWHAEQSAVQSALESLSGVVSVLDVPVGTGRFFRFYKNLNLKVAGYDASKDMLNEARQAAAEIGLEADLTEGDARHLPYQRGSFDLVVCFRFLQSIIPLRDARLVIDELTRVTRRYALLELDFNYDNSPPLRRFTVSEKATMRDRLSEEEVRAMLLEAGLRVTRIYGPFKESSRSQYGFLCEKISEK